MKRKSTKLTVGDTIKNNSRDYMAYYIDDHYPSAIDGLKSIHRRIIYSLRNTGMMKSGNSVARVFELHIHSPDAIYDAMVRMSQTFSMYPTMVTIDGSNGSYSAPQNFAAARYTECSLSDFARDVFTNVNLDTLRMKVTEDLTGKEPVYFIPKIPINLLYSMSNIGYGFTSRPLSFAFEDVCNLAETYIRNNGNIEHLYDELVPYVHGNCVLNFHEVQEGYHKGSFNNGDLKIKYEGIIELLSDSAIRIRTVGAGNMLSTIKEDILNRIKDKSNWLSQECRDFKDLSGKGNIEDADIFMRFKSTSNIFKVIEQLSFAINGTHSVYNNFELDGQMVNLNIKELLEHWYQKRRASVISDIRIKLKDVSLKLIKIDAMLKIINYVDDVISIIRNNTRENAISIFLEKYKLSPYQSSIIRSAGFGILEKAEEQQLLDEQASLTTRFSELRESLNHIDDVIISEIDRIRNRYGKNTGKRKRLVFPKLRDYKGLLILNNGYILIEDIEEIGTYRAMESSKFKCIDFIRFYKEPKFIDNNIYVTRRSAGLLERSKQLNNKFSTSATLIMSPEVDKTVVMTKTGKITIHDGITIFPKMTESKIMYMKGDIGIITSDLQIVKKTKEKIRSKYEEGKYNISRRCLGAFEIPNKLDEGEFLVLVFMNGNKLNLVKYTDDLTAIKIHSNDLTYVGAFVSSDPDNVLVYEDKWFRINLDEKILEEFKTHNYRDMNLNKARFKIGG